MKFWKFCFLVILFGTLTRIDCMNQLAYIDTNFFELIYNFHFDDCGNKYNNVRDPKGDIELLNNLDNGESYPCLRQDRNVESFYSNEKALKVFIKDCREFGFDFSKYMINNQSHLQDQAKSSLKDRLKPFVNTMQEVVIKTIMNSPYRISSGESEDERSKKLRTKLDSDIEENLFNCFDCCGTLRNCTEQRQVFNQFRNIFYKFVYTIKKVGDENQSSEIRLALAYSLRSDFLTFFHCFGFNFEEYEFSKDYLDGFDNNNDNNFDESFDSKNNDEPSNSECSIEQSEESRTLVGLSNMFIEMNNTLNESNKIGLDLVNFYKYLMQKQDNNDVLLDDYLADVRERNDQSLDDCSCFHGKVFDVLSNAESMFHCIVEWKENNRKKLINSRDLESYMSQVDIPQFNNDDFDIKKYIEGEKNFISCFKAIFQFYFLHIIFPDRSNTDSIGKEYASIVEAIAILKRRNNKEFVFSYKELDQDYGLRKKMKKDSKDIMDAKAKKNQDEVRKKMWLIGGASFVGGVSITFLIIYFLKQYKKL